MTGPELKSIRQKLCLSVIEMGQALGYEGQDNTLSVTVRRYELEMRTIPPWIARLAFMYGKHGVPKSFLK